METDKEILSKEISEAIQRFTYKTGVAVDNIKVENVTDKGIALGDKTKIIVYGLHYEMR